MSRTIKWFIPALAFALLLSFSGDQTRAQQEEKKKTGTVSGTVTKEDGTAAAGVRVRVVAPPSKPREGEQPPPAAPTAADEKPPKDKGDKKPRERMKAVAEGTTDEEGKFSIENVPAGKFMVVAGGRGQGMARQPVEVKEGETVTVALQLKAPKRDQ